MTQVIQQSLADRRAHYDRINWSAVEPYQDEVRRDLIKVLPRDVGTILDLGCGSGFIANALPASLSLVGVDISLAALRNLTRPACLASIAELPFADGAFDLVMANDVLEHLPEEEFAAGLREIERVACRYIITTVPFAEDLRLRTQHSAEHNCLRHIDEHVRTFDLTLLQRVYRSFHLDSAVFSGVEWQKESRPVEAFNVLLAELHASRFARHPAETVLTPEDAAEILQMLRADQARALGRAPQLVDFCRLRTEIICLYCRRQRDRTSLKVAHAVRSASVAVDSLPVSAVDLSMIEFHNLDRHLQPWLPTLARFPYVTTSVPVEATPEGARFTPLQGTAPWDLKLGFFCGSEGVGRLELVGNAEDQITLAFAHYGATHDYRPLATKSVQGRFRVMLDELELSHSQYGILFAISVTGGRLVLDTARLILPAAPSYREIHPQPIDYLRVTDGGIECFLSCRYYGHTVPALSWFKNPVDVLSTFSTGDGEASLRAADIALGLKSANLAIQWAKRGLSPQRPEPMSWAAAPIARPEPRAVQFGECLRELVRSKDRLEQAVKFLTAKVHGLAEIAAKLELQASRFEHWQQSIERVLSPLRAAVNLARHGRNRIGLFAGRRRWGSRFLAPPLAIGRSEPGVRGSASAVVMLVADDRIDRRVLAQAQSLIDHGWRVTVVAAPYPGEIDADQQAFPDVRITRIDANAVAPPLLSSLPTRLRATRKWKDAYFYHNHFLARALETPAAIVTAHDLPVLPAAIAAADHHGARLVYDAHELYPEQHHFGPKRMALYREVEGEIIRFADAVTTVNQSIAEEMAHRYRIAVPEVVLNAPLVDPVNLPLPRGNAIRDKLQLEPSRKILLFQGTLSLNRNLEDLTRAMALVTTTDLSLVFLGPGLQKRAELAELSAAESTLGNRVLFLDAVEQGELLEHTASADVGIIPYPPIDLNSRYCTPNKLFEYITAGLPILANDLPELRRFVRDNGFGQVHTLDGPAAIARAIDTMFAADLEGYRRTLRERCKDFTWDGQAGKVLALYERLRASALRAGRGAGG